MDFSRRTLARSSSWRSSFSVRNFGPRATPARSTRRPTCRSGSTAASGTGCRSGSAPGTSSSAARRRGAEATATARGTPRRRHPLPTTEAEAANAKLLFGLFGRSAGLLRTPYPLPPSPLLYSPAVPGRAAERPEAAHDHVLVADRVPHNLQDLRAVRGRVPRGEGQATAPPPLALARWPWAPPRSVMRARVPSLPSLRAESPRSGGRASIARARSMPSGTPSWSSSRARPPGSFALFVASAYSQRFPPFCGMSRLD